MIKNQSIISSLTVILAFGLSGAGLTSCGPDDIDNLYSRNNSTIQISTSGSEIILDEEHSDEVALTVDWNEAYSYGDEYITTYQYQIDAEGSLASSVKEYEDDGNYHRSYTHAELQELLTNHFGAPTSSRTTLTFTVTASFVGPRVVLPDISTLNVVVKTYGEKQFKADRMWLGGSATGDQAIELSSSTEDIYTWSGSLKAGTLNFQVEYEDEKNAIGPKEPNAPISESEMEAVITDASKANYWVLPSDANYRITVDMLNQTVKIVDAGEIIEVNHLFMKGTATGNAEIAVGAALEAEGLYAWKGELQSGTLYFPIEYAGETSTAIVPKDASDHTVADGTRMDLGLALIETGIDGRYWEIPSAGTYRVVVNTTDHVVTIYSSATDMKNTQVSYNNTVDGINPYTQEVTELWMWGGFNDAAHDPGLKAGFQEKYKLIQSVADPNVFVYYGGVLPRGKSTDDWSGATGTGAMVFLVSNIENNVYAYGSTADAKRNDHRGYLDVNLGETLQLVPGQSDNRYANFNVPENCNYVVVDIKKLTVYFGHK